MVKMKPKEIQQELDEELNNQFDNNNNDDDEIYNQDEWAKERHWTWNQINQGFQMKLPIDSILNALEYWIEWLKKIWLDRHIIDMLSRIFDVWNNKLDVNKINTEDSKKIRIILWYIFIHDKYKDFIGNNQKTQNPQYVVLKKKITEALNKLETSWSDEEKDNIQKLKETTDEIMKRYWIRFHTKADRKNGRDTDMLTGRWWYVKHCLQNILFADFMVDILWSPEDPWVITIWDQRYQIYIADSFLDRKVGIDIVLQNISSEEKIYIDRFYFSNQKDEKEYKWDRIINVQIKDIISKKIVGREKEEIYNDTINMYINKYLGKKIKYTSSYKKEIKDKLQNLLLEHIQKSEEHNS